MPPKPRQKPPELKLKLRPAVLEKQDIAPRSPRPRLSVVPSLDIHPELSRAPVKLAVSLPDVAGPGLTANGGIGALEWSPAAPEAANAAAPAEGEREPEPATPSAPAAVPAPLRPREPDRKPAAVYAPRPEYPVVAQQRGIEGHVTLRLHIGADGKVDDVKVVECRGHVSFKRAAVRAVERWRFSPATQAGRPVALWCTKKLTFRIER
jgi:protein TonB